MAAVADDCRGTGSRGDLDSRSCGRQRRPIRYVATAHGKIADAVFIPFKQLLARRTASCGNLLACRRSIDRWASAPRSLRPMNVTEPVCKRIRLRVLGRASGSKRGRPRATDSRRAPAQRRRPHVVCESSGARRRRRRRPSRSQRRCGGVAAEDQAVARPIALESPIHRRSPCPLRVRLELVPEQPVPPRLTSSSSWSAQVRWQEVATR